MEEIGAFTDKNVTKRCVSAVTGAAKQQKPIIHFSREKYPVPVEWHEETGHSEKRLEILCPSQTDGRPPHVFTPDNISDIFNFHKSRIIAVIDGIGVILLIHPIDGIWADFPPLSFSRVFLSLFAFLIRSLFALFPSFHQFRSYLLNTFIIQWIEKQDEDG